MVMASFRALRPDERHISVKLPALDTERSSYQGSPVYTIDEAPPIRCCSVCPYRPARIHWLLRMFDTLAQSGYSPVEAFGSVLDHNGTDYAVGFGIRAGLTDVADVHRAIAAGKRSPRAIAAFLCPFGIVDDAPVDDDGKPDVS